MLPVAVAPSFLATVELMVQALQAAAQVDAEIKSRQGEASRVELS